MNYQLVYDKIISRARLQNRVKLSKKHKDYVYYEAHHIKPKCLGGEGRCNQWKWHPNIVLLTPKEHFICHLILAHLYPNNNSIVSAVWMMCNSHYTKSGQHRYKPSSNTYERIRLMKNKATVTLETRIKQSQAQKGNKNGSANKGNKYGPHKEETRIKIGLANKGRVHSSQSRLNMSLAHIGKKGKRRIVCCPHCKKEGGANAMTRYHFDNCKSLYK